MNRTLRKRNLLVDGVSWSLWPAPQVRTKTGTVARCSYLYIHQCLLSMAITRVASGIAN